MTRIGDAHLHTNPVKGLGAERIAKEFLKANGWFMAIVALPPYHYGVDDYPRIEAYEKTLRILERECRIARSLGLRVSCLMGMHPAEVDRIEQALGGLDKVFEIVDAVAKLLDRACRENVIDGIGEIGRQHYRTLPHRFAAAEYAMIRLAEVARDNDCIIHLHLEDSGRVTARTVNYLLSLIGVRPDRVVFHHASARTAYEALSLGYTATVVGKREAVKAALEKCGPRFMVESDFIDDPKRPCVAQCPWRLGEEVKAAVNGDENTAEKILIDNIVRFYRVEPP